MEILYLLVGIILQSTQAFSVSSVQCTLQNARFDDIENEYKMDFYGNISITYDRSNLAIYRYINTQLVNLILWNANVTFNGKHPAVNSTDSIISLSTDIEGVALLQRNSGEIASSPDNFHITECDFNFGKNMKKTKKVPATIQQTIAKLAHNCARKNLCSDFGLTGQDEFILAKIEPHDFKEKSVPYKIFSNKYPNLVVAKNKTKTGLEETVDFFFDFLVASIISKESRKESGKIDYPNVDEKLSGPMMLAGYVKLINGTIGDLNTIKRTQDIILNNEGLDFTLDVAYQIPKPHIHFDRYEIKYVLMTSSGYVDVYIDGINLRIKVLISFNEMPCKIQVTTMEIEMGNMTTVMSDNITFDFAANKLLNKLTSLLRSNINGFLRKKITQLTEDVVDDFNCEKWRP